MGEETIDVLLVDDHAMVREGLAAVISRDPGLRVVGECGDGLQVVPEALRLRPHVIVLDIAMPGANGLDLCRTLRRKVKDSAILILTMYDEKEFLARAIDNGASGYVVKGAEAAELRQAIRAAAQGQLHFPPGLSQDLPDQLRRARGDPFNSLTGRQKQVFQMIAEGKTTRRIAVDLGLSPKTVDAHRTRLMHKLNLHNVGDLVRFAVRRGVVGLP